MMNKKLYIEIRRARVENAKISYLAIFASALLFFLFKYGGIEDSVVINMLILATSIIAGPLMFSRYNKKCVAICPRCKSVVERPSIFKANKSVSCPSCGLVAEK
jgi:hypothetical protein